MRFAFADRKTAQAAAYLLRRHGGSFNYMHLIKLLYLADRKRLLLRGEPLTGDRHFSMKHGPVLSQVLDFITHGPELGNSAWFDYISAPSGYTVSLKPDAATSTDELSRAELKLLEEVDEQFGQLNEWDLVALLHKILPEWNDPGKSARPITPEEILRADGRSAEEIEEVRTLADELWFLSTAA